MEAPVKPVDGNLCREQYADYSVESIKHTSIENRSSKSLWGTAKRRYFEEQ